MSFWSLMDYQQSTTILYFYQRYDDNYVSSLFMTLKEFKEGV